MFYYRKLIFAILVLQGNDVSAFPQQFNTTRENYDDERIVGGYYIDITRVPHQAFLLSYLNDGERQICGGSILNTRFILTAAHCFDNTRSVKVRIGSTYKSSGGQVYSKTTFETHPYYNNYFDYDVAYVRTLEEMNLDGVTSRAVSLSNEYYNVIPGTEMLITGWGKTSKSGSGHFSEALMAVKVPIVSNEVCRLTDPMITDRMICAGYRNGGKNACYGDSGGATMINGLQVGIVSHVFTAGGCARPNNPVAFTKVSNPEIRHWIRTNTGA